MSRQQTNRIEEFRRSIGDMGTRSAEMVRKAQRMIADEPTPEAVAELERDEETLDRLQVELDEEAIALMTLFSPVAHNLRLIMASTRISAEVERIGDQVINICSFLRESRPTGEVVTQLKSMANLAAEMVENAVQAFVEKDVQLAATTIKADDQLDDVLHDISRSCDCFTARLIAQSLERIGDQATNVCESVIYSERGQDVRHAVREVLDHVKLEPSAAS